MSQTELANALRDTGDPEWLVRNNLSGFLEELSRHMAQGSDGAVGLRRELKNGRRTGGESGGRELRRDHKNGALTLPRMIRLSTDLFGNAKSKPQDRQCDPSEGHRVSGLTNVFDVTNKAIIDGVACVIECTVSIGIKVLANDRCHFLRQLNRSLRRRPVCG